MEDDTGLNESRGFACEIVAGQFLTYLSEHELVDLLLSEIPDVEAMESPPRNAENGRVRWPHKQKQSRASSNERSPLLDHDHDGSSSPLRRPGQSDHGGFSQSLQNCGSSPEPDVKADSTKSFAGMNALEIAAVANAKKFLSQRVVQRIVEDIWHGNIIFWESMSIHSRKKPQVYNKRCVLCLTTQ